MITSNTTNGSILDSFRNDLVASLENNPDLSNTCIGVSHFITSFDNISTMLIDAIFANASCILDKRKIVKIENAPFDHIIFKDRYLLGPNLYYEELLEKLSETSAQRSPLLETLITLIECNGNVDMASQKLFQHKNTIRYRLNKLKILFSTDNDMEFYGKLYLFSRIHFSKQYLDVFFHQK